MELRAVSIPDYEAQRQVLRFPPPMLEHARDPARLEFGWRLLQYCFDFPDPASAKKSELELSIADSRIIGRFVGKAVSLAKSPFLAHPTGMTVTVKREGGLQLEDVTTRFPEEESERGFLTLLRQFAHADEPASFKRVQAIAMAADRDESDLNADLLRSWGKYHKKLLHRSPESWAYIKGSPPGTPYTDIPLASGTARVDEMMRTYFYGDIIHFGEGRDDLEALDEDEFLSAHNRMNLFGGASGLAKFYMGYATVLARIHPATAP